MYSKGFIQNNAVFAGHSLGQYSALTSAACRKRDEEDWGSARQRQQLAYIFLVEPLPTSSPLPSGGGSLSTSLTVSSGPRPLLVCVAHDTSEDMSNDTRWSDSFLVSVDGCHRRSPPSEFQP